jgi:hypothetical protein
MWLKNKKSTFITIPIVVAAHLQHADFQIKNLREDPREGQIPGYTSVT